MLMLMLMMQQLTLLMQSHEERQEHSLVLSLLTSAPIVLTHSRTHTAAVEHTE